MLWTAEVKVINRNDDEMIIRGTVSNEMSNENYPKNIDVHHFSNSYFEKVMPKKMARVGTLNLQIKKIVFAVVYLTQTTTLIWEKKYLTTGGTYQRVLKLAKQSQITDVLCTVD